MLAANVAPAVAAAGVATVQVSLGDAKMVHGISVSGDVATPQELGVSFIQVGRSNSRIPANVQWPWSGVVNQIGTNWYRFPTPVRTEGQQTLSVTVANNNAAASDIAVGVEYS